MVSATPAPSGRAVHSATATRQRRCRGPGPAAESALKSALDSTDLSYELKPGDGAFYGPKIDFCVLDAVRREWQLSTIQLDFFLPERFALKYVDPSGKDQRPVMVHRYPVEAKAFYMKENPADPRTVLCDDLIAPEGYGELIGGSQREDDHGRLVARIREQNLPMEAYGWYLDLRKYGTFPHSGFGLGVERTVAWITGRPHIRETIPFPRTIYRLYP